MFLWFQWSWNNDCICCNYWEMKLNAKLLTNSSHPLGDLFKLVIKKILHEIYNKFQPIVRILNKRENDSISSNIGPQVQQPLFTLTLHGSKCSYFSFERLFLPSICIGSSFQPSVQTNWRISGFASAKSAGFSVHSTQLMFWRKKKFILYLLNYEPQTLFDHMFRKLVPRAF